MRQFSSEMDSVTLVSVAPLMVILRLKMICYYKGLEEKNAHKTEFWIKSVERETYIKQRAKPLPTTTIYQDKKSVQMMKTLLIRDAKMLIPGFLLIKLC
jgi:hypothetical protein